MEEERKFSEKSSYAIMGTNGSASHKIHQCAKVAAATFPKNHSLYPPLPLISYWFTQCVDISCVNCCFSPANHSPPVRLCSIRCSTCVWPSTTPRSLQFPRSNDESARARVCVHGVRFHLFMRLYFGSFPNEYDYCRIMHCWFVPSSAAACPQLAQAK